MLDLDALTKRVSESVGVPAQAGEPLPDEAAPLEGVEVPVTLAEAGDRALAAFKHGDGESFAQAVLDIMARGK